MKILYLRPAVSSDPNEAMQELLNQAVRVDTEVTVAASTGERPRHLEYHTYEAAVSKDLVVQVREASKQGYDAVVLGGFYDLGLRAAREISGNTVVTAPCESSTAIARMLGRRFSVLVERKKWIPYVMDNLHRYGHRDALASIRAIDLSGQAIRDQPEETKTRLIEQARRAVNEDSAEVIILGCAAKYGLHREMTELVGVPVIDSMLAAIKMAECLSESANRFDWYPSRALGSEPPPEEEVEAWNLFP